MAHPVGLEPQRRVEGVLRHGLEVVGPVEERGAVEVGGAQFLQRVQVLALQVLRALEHEVLEQVGEAGAAPDLVLRAHVVPDVHRHDGRLAVLVHDDGQAVVELPQRVGDVHAGGIRGRRREGGLGEEEGCGEDGKRVLERAWQIPGSGGGF